MSRFLIRMRTGPLGWGRISCAKAHSNGGQEPAPLLLSRPDQRRESGGFVACARPADGPRQAISSLERSAFASESHKRRHTGIDPALRGDTPRRANDGKERVQVLVRDNNVDQALKALKKKMQREGIFREMKLRGHYEKPSEKKAREKAEAVRRARKLARKRAQREGLLPSKAPRR